MKPRVFLATPMYGGQCHGLFADSVIKLVEEFRKKKWHFEYHFMYDQSLITRARDNFVNDFMVSDCTHLLFLDADVIINPPDVIRMLQEDVELLCGCYPSKIINWEWVEYAVKNGCPREKLPFYSTWYIFNAAPNTNPQLDHEPDKLKEAIHAGTGYMLIKRIVFEKLAEHTPTYIGNWGEYTGRTIYAFFQTSIDVNLLSEDYHFCNEWRKIGGKVLIAPYARSKHYGTFGFG
jgi:hypothetical protein